MTKVHLMDHHNNRMAELKNNGSPPYGPPHYNRMDMFKNGLSPPYGPPQTTIQQDSRV
jgi:hypothetical protein